jgi:RNA polymerase sigma factor (sigma-70 family)
MEDVLSVAADLVEQPGEQHIEQPTELPGEPNRRLSDIIHAEYRRLYQFIRKRVGDPGEAEDILQDVFYEFIEAQRLMRPIEQVGAWLYRVARNRIIDRFRRQRSAGNEIRAGTEEESLQLEDLLPSRDAGPEAAYARSVLIEELEAAIDDLPEEQRSVFVAHELEGRSFKEIADETGVNMNTLLSRKRYAVAQLRRRLKAIYEEFRCMRYKHESKMGKESVEDRGHSDRGRRRLRIYLNESVELARAGDIRSAHDHFLAGARNPDIEQDAVRRVWRTAWPWGALERSNEKPLGRDDSRRTREIQAGIAQPSWPRADTGGIR